MPACADPNLPSSPPSRGAVDAPSRLQASGMRRPRLHAESLFGGANEIEIQHGEAIYRLRITSLGKLILTK